MYAGGAPPTQTPRPRQWGSPRGCAPPAHPTTTRPSQPYLTMAPVLRRPTGPPPTRIEDIVCAAHRALPAREGAPYAQWAAPTRTRKRQLRRGRPEKVSSIGTAKKARSMRTARKGQLHGGRPEKASSTGDGLKRPAPQGRPIRPAQWNQKNSEPSSRPTVTAFFIAE